MWIVAVDPGETSGVAVFDSSGTYPVKTRQYEDPLDIARFVDRTLRSSFSAVDITVVVESFPGGGPRTTPAIHTLKVLGFVEYYARLLGLPVVLQVPQQRKWKVQEARQLLDKKDVHAIDALAHALAYAATRVKTLCDGGLTEPV